jgi:hypothetical protein
MEIRFHNPYRHAVLGLLTEIAVFVAFLAFSIALALLFAWAA